MSEIPKSIQIGPFSYRVVDLERTKIGEGLLGEILYTELTIALETRTPYMRLAETLLHETLHGIWNLMGIPISDDTKEHIIAALGPALLDTMRRNPDLMLYLLGPEEGHREL